MLTSLFSALTTAVTGSAPSETPSSPQSPPAVVESSTPPPPSSSPPPSNSPPLPATPSTEPAAQDLEDLALDSNPCFDSSGYLKRLVARGGHQPSRIRAIKRAALRDVPPVEPKPWECCDKACQLECVVVIWWEEEKTWRDMHPDDWKEIKKRIKAEEEDRQREAEEEAALNGEDVDDGEPSVAVAVE